MTINILSSEQKAQVKNAFTLIDCDSKDGAISAQDLIHIHKTAGLPQPSDAQIKSMLNDQESITFAQFSKILAHEFAKLDDRVTISNALKVLSGDNSETMTVDADKLKAACCSVQLGDIGAGDCRLARSTFDELTGGFIKEQMDGLRLFHARNWLDAYIE